MPILLKFMLTSLIIVGVSELAKRVSWAAAILASLPIVSILAMIWIYIDTKDTQKIISFSYDVFFAVFPSLLFFLALPFLLKLGLPFALSMILSMAITAVGYGIYILFA